MAKLRIYLDTSVFGGYYDAEFETDSKRILELIHGGTFRLVVSTITLAELRMAPSAVRELFNGISSIEHIEADDEVLGLRDAYINAGVLGLASLADAEHVAAASVAGVDLIVSWNFKHVVNFDRIRGFHAVNLELGYPAVPIHAPTEVRPDA